MMKRVIKLYADDNDKTVEIVAHIESKLSLTQEESSRRVSELEDLLWHVLSDTFYVRHIKRRK